MINSYGSDWLISSSAEELNEKLKLFEKINGIPTKFIFRKINLSNFIYKRIGSYDIVVGDMFEIGQKINGKVAIVNPANMNGLGCFNPAHKCIDNQLHRHEGPRLRVLLNKIPIKNNKRIEITQPIEMKKCISSGKLVTLSEKIKVTRMPKSYE